MAIPTSYDYNGFAGFLRNEVLRFVADTMLWEYEEGADIAAGSSQVIQLNGATVDNARTLTVDALPATIYAGNQITFTGHATTYIAAETAAAGATTVYVYPYVNGVIADNTVGSYTPRLYRKTHPAYRAITDEALLALGYTDIAQVTGTKEVQKLRLMGRIEAWRAVMSNTVSDMSTETENTFYNRAQVFFSAKDQCILAEQEYIRQFGIEQEFEPSYAMTYSEKIKVGW